MGTHWIGFIPVNDGRITPRNIVDTRMSAGEYVFHDVKAFRRENGDVPCVPVKYRIEFAPMTYYMGDINLLAQLLGSWVGIIQLDGL